MPIRLDTLGTLRTFRDGQELERLPAQPVRCAVLLYLAMEREAPRDSVLGMFWPESSAEQARHTLNQTLYELRRMLGDDWVDVRGDRLHVSDRVEVDALEFARAVEAGDAPFALGLYRGAFLGGAPPATTRAFEGWVDQWTAHLGRLHRRACKEAIEGRVAAEDLTGAVRLARRWTDIDPLDDEAQHRLIELLALDGDRSEALRQYERYERLLQEELDLEPLVETKELVGQIRSGELNGNGSAQQPEGGATPAGTAEQDTPGRDAAPEDTAEPTAPALAPDRTTGSHEAGSPATTAGTATPGSASSIIDELRQRRVLPWTLAYLVVALAALVAVRYLSPVYGWSPAIARRLPVFLGFGALVAIVLAWYHGAAGRRRATSVEAGLLGVLVMGALVVASVTGEGPKASTTAAVSRLDLARIAVLPLEDLSNRGDLAPLAGQLADALTDRLAQVPVLHVLPRAATRPFGGGRTPFDSIVKALNAGAIVEGTVMRAGPDEYQATVQLIDATSSIHLLSDTFTAAISQPDPAADIADRASRALLERLHSELVLREMHARAPNERAWRLFLRARNVATIEAGRGAKLWQDDPHAAEALLDQADSLLAEDEHLAPHWLDPTVMRARVETIRALRTASPGMNYEPAATRRAIQHLDRVLRQDPDYVPALADRGLLRYRLGENAPAAEADTLYNRAEADLRHAVRIDTLQAEAWSVLYQIDHRKNALNTAAADAERAVKADVFRQHRPAYLWHEFMAFLNLEAFRRSVDVCDELTQSRHASAYKAYCNLYLMSGMPGARLDVDSAWQLAEHLRPREYGDMFVAKVLARAGLRDSAQHVLHRDLAQPTDSILRFTAYDAAHAWLLLGDRDEAIHYLRIYVRLKPAAIQSLPRDWLFRPLWSDPEFQQLAGERGPG
ncbi:MAG: BTAD domain-containing putative transcriptional regulator [Gemmatimonadota bacterium]